MRNEKDKKYLGFKYSKEPVFCGTYFKISRDITLENKNY